MERIFELDNINDVAKWAWESIGNSNVVAFHGHMGAGKTTFIHALCDAKGVRDIVGSPTFSIVNEYVFMEGDSQRKIYHIDLYRLNNEEEAIRAGVEDCLYSDHISLVEWPEKAPGVFPDETVHVRIELIDGQRRRLTIGKN